MPKFKLTEEMGTTYIYCSYIPMFKDFINSLEEGSFNTIDIAGARITPDISEEINKNIVPGHIMFVDSENKNNDDILRYNYQLASMNMTFEPLPEFKLGTDPIDYILNLDASKNYEINPDNRPLYMNLMILIMLIRPTIFLNVSGILGKMLSLIREILCIGDVEEFTKDTDDFQYYYKGSLVEFSTPIKTDDEIFNVYGIGYTTWSGLLRDYLVIPGYVGKENVFDVDEELWSPVLDTITERILSVKEPMTLAKFVTRVS